MSAKTLQAICELVKSAFTSVDLRDGAMLVTLAAAQQDGRSVGMKQLVILDGATPTTLRRRIAHLIRLGYVEKRVNKQDGRAITYVVTATVWKRLEKLRKSFLQILRALEARGT